MSKKILQYIVFSLGVLIFLAFIAFIYGMYLNISTNSKDTIFDSRKISLNLKNGEKIIDMQVIDNNRLLILIDFQSEIRGLIYYIKEKKISETIEK